MQEVAQSPSEITSAAAVTPVEDEVKEKPKPGVPTRTKMWSTNPAEGVDIAMGEEEIQKVAPITIPEALKDSAQKYGSRNALGYKEEDEWKCITYTEYYQFVISAAKSFVKVS